jgi:hypothetical protein
MAASVLRVRVRGVCSPGCTRAHLQLPDLLAHAAQVPLEARQQRLHVLQDAVRVADLRGYVCVHAYVCACVCVRVVVIRRPRLSGAVDPLVHRHTHERTEAQPVPMQPHAHGTWSCSATMPSASCMYSATASSSA